MRKWIALVGTLVTAACGGGDDVDPFARESLCASCPAGGAGGDDGKAGAAGRAGSAAGGSGGGAALPDDVCVSVEDGEPQCQVLGKRTFIGCDPIPPTCEPASTGQFCCD